MIDSPCYQCVNRNPGCHQFCDRHLRWKEEDAARKQMIREARAKDVLVDNAKTAFIGKTKRATGWKKPGWRR